MQLSEQLGRTELTTMDSDMNLPWHCLWSSWRHVGCPGCGDSESTLLSWSPQTCLSFTPLIQSPLLSSSTHWLRWFWRTWDVIHMYSFLLYDQNLLVLALEHIRASCAYCGTTPCWGTAALRAGPVSRMVYRSVAIFPYSGRQEKPSSWALLGFSLSSIQPRVSWQIEDPFPAP